MQLLLRFLHKETIAPSPARESAQPVRLNPNCDGLRITVGFGEFPFLRSSLGSRCLQTGTDEIRASIANPIFTCLLGKTLFRTQAFVLLHCACNRSHPTLQYRVWVWLSTEFFFFPYILVSRYGIL